MSTDTMDRADLVCGRQLPELLHQPSTYHHQDADEQDRQRESQDCEGDLRADCVAGIGPEYRQSEWAKSGYAHHDSVSGMVPSPLWPIGRADPPTTERTKQQALADLPLTEVTPPYGIASQRYLIVTFTCAVHETSPHLPLLVLHAQEGHTLCGCRISTAGVDVPIKNARRVT